MVSVEDLNSDHDLASRRSNPAWPAFIARATRAVESRMHGVNRALRDELLARTAKDQTIRNALIKDMKNPVLGAEATRIDKENTAWMKQVLQIHGWPGESLVLKDGSKATWLLVQHADMDRPFQKQALELLKAAVSKGEARGADLAYLTDRVRIGEGKPQVYGTQFHTVDGKLVPEAIEDAVNVDVRRASVGLPTLAAYAELMAQTYKPDK